jgi:hypothetical protein
MDKLPAWKGRMLQRSSRLTLIKTTLCVVLVYTSISIAVPKWLVKAIQEILKAFLWSGSKLLQNGKCSVAWTRLQRPLHLGGLRIMDLRLLGIALRARWLWLHRSNSCRSYAALPLSEDVATIAFFNVSIQMSLGNGETLFFWSDPWLHGVRLAEIAPELTAAVPPRCLKRCLVACALRGRHHGRLNVPHSNVVPRHLALPSTSAAEARGGGLFCLALGGIRRLLMSLLLLGAVQRTDIHP